jgi:hypothetical protein
MLAGGVTLRQECCSEQYIFSALLANLTPSCNENIIIIVKELGRVPLEMWQRKGLFSVPCIILEYVWITGGIISVRAKPSFWRKNLQNDT